MLGDPVWWETFDHKFTMVMIVITSLISIVAGIWRLSRRYTNTLHRLDEKVSHKELKQFKLDILDHVEKSGEQIKLDMIQDRKENRDDHKELLRSLGDLNRLFVSHIDRISK